MKVNDLVEFGYAWKNNVSWSSNINLKFVDNFIEKINKSLGWTEGSGKTRVCHNLNEQLLIKHGTSTSKYDDLISMLQNDKVATKWILEFLEGKRDFNDNIGSKNAVYAKDFVCIVCIAEVARGYGKSSLEELTKFIEGIVKGINDWSELKNVYVAANSSSKDEAYVPEEEDMECESDEE